MQPEIFSFSSPMSRWRSSEAKRLRDVLRHDDRAGVGQRAIVKAGAGDDVADQVRVGGGEADLDQPVIDRLQVGARDMRQDRGSARG